MIQINVHIQYGTLAVFFHAMIEMLIFFLLLIPHPKPFLYLTFLEYTPGS